MGIEIKDETGLDLGAVALRGAAFEIAKAIDLWSRDKKTPLSMFTRESFTQPATRKAALASARLSTHDDVVASTIEFAESLALDQVTWESPDADVTKLWNSTAETSGLDQWVRESFWELSTTGVVTTAVWWGNSVHRPSGTGPGGARARRAKSAIMPQRLVTLPTERIFRLDTFWNTQKLLWIADDSDEVDLLLSADDPTMQRLVVGRYIPNLVEKLQISNAELDPQLCLLLDPKAVFQVKLPGQDYGNGFVTPMTRVLPWLEQKARLLDSDRASLIGAANYLMVFKLGTEERPGTQEEASMFQDQLVRIAKMPFIISDHRLQVEILSPDTTGVLNETKHAVVNARITAATLGLPDNSMLPGDIDPEIAARMAMARMQSRRNMLAIGARAHIALPGMDLNGAPLENAPSISFMPRQIPLVGVMAAMNSALAARSRGDLSRHSYLETLGYDHDVELGRVTEEDESGANDKFLSHTPFDSPANTNNGQPTGASGTQGGRPQGGRTGQGQPKGGTPK